MPAARTQQGTRSTQARLQMPQIMISLVGDVCCRNHGLEGGRAWRNPLGGRASEKGARGLSQVTGAVPSAERRRSCCGRLRTRWSHTWWPKNKHPNALSSSKLLPELVGFLLFLLDPEMLENAENPRLERGRSSTGPQNTSEITAQP